MDGPAALDLAPGVHGTKSTSVSVIRVLRIIGLLDPEYGGTSEAAVSECIASQRAGIANTFAFGVDTGSRSTTQEAQQRLSREGVVVLPFKVLPIASYYARRWGLSLSLCRWVVGHVRGFDVVHLHQTWGLPQVVGLIAASLGRRPCVVTPNESLTDYDVQREKQLLKRGLKQLYLRYASLIVFASPLEAADSVGTRFERKSAVLPHPLPEASSTPGAQASATRRSARSHQTPHLTVGFLGRLHPKKNVHLLIDALSRLAGDVRLRVAGEGPEEYTSWLISHTSRCGVADRVEWLGFVKREDRAQFFADVDLVALVSEYECFGLAAAEAMGDGVAVLVSEQTGIASTVSQYECGFVISPDVQSIVATLQGAIAQKELLAELGMRGAAAVRQELSMEAYGLRVRCRYEEVLQRARGDVDAMVLEDQG